MFQINWKLKALLYKVFGLLKLKNTYFFIQKHITKRSKINIKEINKLWLYHANSIEKYNIRKILEIGTGKSLEQNIYISYRFNNLIHQTAIDINNMIDLELVNQANEQISNILKIENKGKIENLDGLKKLYNINYLAPCDLKRIKNSSEKFDMCVSTTALEHFTLSDLEEYLEDLKTTLKKEGLVSSIIDYSDHYSHTDKNISGLNFLRFSAVEWEKYNNSYLFQNRLRHQDYKAIFESTGYKIKEIFLGDLIKPPLETSSEFDVNNEETFVGWAYFLINRLN